MLQAIRTSINSWFMRILFILLIASFAIWGIGDIFRGVGSEQVVVDVASLEISGSELEQAVFSRISQIQQRTGQALTVEQARELGLVEQARETLIQQKLFDLATEDLHLLVGDDLIRIYLTKQSEFHNAFGQFSAPQFHQALQILGTNETRYVDLMRRQIAHQIIASAVTGGAIAPDIMVRDLYQYQNEKRTSQSLLLTYQSVESPAQPDEATLQAYHQENALRYISPVLRRLSLILLTKDQFLGEITLTEEELRTAFDEQLDQFAVVEKRSFHHVVVDSLERAAAIIEQADQNDDGLAAVANSDANLDLISLSEVTKEALPELGDDVFTLNQGDIGGPVSSSFGWHVLSVTQITPAQDANFDQARESLSQDLKQEHAINRLYDTVNTLDQNLFEEDILLEDAIADLGLTITTIEGVDAEGNDSEGQQVEIIAEHSEIIELAFSLEESETSLLTETATEGVFFVVRVDSIIPTQDRTLDQVREQVTADWTLDQQKEVIRERVSGIVERLRSNGDLQAIAEEFNLEVTTIGPLTRQDDTPEGVSEALIQEMFTLSLNDVTDEATDSGHRVLQVTAIEQAVLPAETETVETETDTPDTATETAETETDTPDTATETAETQTDTPDTATETVETETDTPDTATETAETETDTPDTATETVETETDTPDTATETVETETDTPDTATETVETETDTPDTATETAETETDTPDTATETAETQTDTSDTATETTETQTDTPDTATETAETETDTPDTATETVETETDTPDTATETVETETDTPDTATETAETETDTPDTATETVETETDTPDTATETAETQTDTTDTATETAETETETSDTATETVETETDTPDTATETAEIETETSDTATETAETETDTPDTATETVETETDTPDTATETVETETDTPDTATETAETQTDTPDTATETVETETDTPDTATETAETETDTTDTPTETAETETDTPDTATETAETETDTPDTATKTAETETDTPDTATETAETQTETTDTATETAETQTDTTDTATETAETETETSDTATETAETETDTPDTADAETTETATEEEIRLFNHLKFVTAKAIAEDIFRQFTESLRQSYDVTIHEDVIENLFDQDRTQDPYP